MKSRGDSDTLAPTSIRYKCAVMVHGEPEQTISYSNRMVPGLPDTIEEFTNSKTHNITGNHEQRISFFNLKKREKMY